MRILLIEDEHKIAAGIKRALEREAHAVDVEYDGNDGLSAAIETDYDLIILDVMLPGGLDGMEVCRQIRAEGKQTPVLMLTARDAIADRVEGLDSGADDYLVKPFALEELLARTRALLRRPNDLQDAVLSAGDIMLDPTSYIVTKNGKVVTLSRKEYALLEYFLRNQDRVLTKDQIIEHVWDYDADVLPNTVEVYVNYLRRKLEQKGRPLIQTVRGFGYRVGEA